MGGEGKLLALRTKAETRSGNETSKHNDISLPVSDLQIDEWTATFISTKDISQEGVSPEVWHESHTQIVVKELHGNELFSEAANLLLLI